MYDDEQSGERKITTWGKTVVLLSALLTMVIADSPTIWVWLQHHPIERTVVAPVIILANTNSETR